MPPASVHAVCVALVALDVAARTLRLREVLRALGQPLPLGRLLTIGLAADAASALTPCRVGGDVARTVGLRRAGVPSWQAAAAVVVDTVQTWPIVLAGGGVLAWLYGGAWWAAFSAGISCMVPRVESGPMAGAVSAAAILAAATFVWNRRTRRTSVESASLPRPRFATARLARTLPLTLVAVAARVAILPVLAASVAGAPPAGATALGSLALLHAQSFLPMPAGAGAVDVGFVSTWSAGAAATRVLVAWRLYTSGLPTAAGAGVLLRKGLIRLRRRAHHRQRSVGSEVA
jgi:uncharacterized membrane protein YbhN (UPF0104 family)